MMPGSSLRRPALDPLRFSGRRRRSGDGDGSTLTLTLVAGTSGAATTTTTPDLSGNLHCPWDCWEWVVDGVWDVSVHVECIVFVLFCWCVLDFLCVVVRAGSHELCM